MPEGPQQVDIQMDVDPTTANPARVYDYLLGGKDNYAADRAAAGAMIAQLPALPQMMRENREFLGRAVRHLVCGLGVRQFLDVGSGIPTVANVHEVAQGVDPAARVVYVDNDPMVLAHSRALLNSGPAGRTAFVHGEALEPEGILEHPDVFGTLDRSEPIALMLVSVLMYFTDHQARTIVTTLIDALPRGSYLTISHPTADFDPVGAAKAAAVARDAGLTYNTRTRSEVNRFFTGLDLAKPGVVPMLSWQPSPALIDPQSVYYWVGMARKA